MTAPGSAQLALPEDHQTIPFSSLQGTVEFQMVLAQRLIEEPFQSLYLRLYRHNHDRACEEAQSPSSVVYPLPATQRFDAIERETPQQLSAVQERSLHL